MSAISLALLSATATAAVLRAPRRAPVVHRAPRPCSVEFDRRSLLAAACAAPAAGFALPAFAADSSPLSFAWTATDGFSNATDGFITFDEGAYAAMRDDESRTPIFEAAIKKRLAGTDDQVVVDIGTGPYALLAIMAARAGAKRVYAIEAEPELARRARAAVAKAGLGGVVSVVDGFTTSVSLPEKADLALAEIVGSVASEEGCIATIRDAQARLLKRPNDPESWIPQRAQTLGAPASYALHYSLGPENGFDWTKLKEPVRLNCRDETLALLAEPQLLEDISFADANLPAAGAWRPVASPTRWSIDADRIAKNEETYFAELKREGVKEAEAKPLAASVARSLSGVALWPRLILDSDGEFVCQSRGARGESRKSHWQTVLPLLSARPVDVTERSAVTLRYEVDLGREVAAPPKYKLDGDVA